jgi:DNA-binding LytR/AlgR family response regulator
LVLATIKGADHLLPMSKFCRVHKSYIVHIERIKNFDGKTMTLTRERDKKSDIMLPIGQVYINELMKRLISIPESIKTNVNSDLRRSMSRLIQQSI